MDPVSKSSAPPGPSRAARSLASGIPSRWLPRMLRTLAALGLAGLALGVGWFASRRATPALGTPPDRSRTFSDFRLTERSGRPLTRADLDGKICVVSFVFTSCGVSCLEVSRNLTRLQTRLESGPDDVRLVSLTVDPRTDTPDVLSRFADRFEASPRRWVFLTGDSSELERLIETSFLPRNPIPGQGSASLPFLGIGRVFVVDRQGRVRGSFDGVHRSSAEALHQAIRSLRSES